MKHITIDLLEQGHRAVEAEHTEGICRCSETVQMLLDNSLMQAMLAGIAVQYADDVRLAVFQAVMTTIQYVEYGLEARATGTRFDHPTSMETDWANGPGRIVSAIRSALATLHDDAEPAASDAELAELRRIAGIAEA